VAFVLLHRAFMLSFGASASMLEEALGFAREGSIEPLYLTEDSSDPVFIEHLDSRFECARWRGENLQQKLRAAKRPRPILLKRFAPLASTDKPEDERIVPGPRQQQVVSPRADHARAI